jgi:hypothetical protein
MDRRQSEKKRHAQQGGHGFGMYKKQTTSTGWFDAYVRWRGMRGMLTRAK